MKSPFKFLDSYTKDDREIFFGRDREIEELYQKVFDSKLLLVYGVSGTGKSSLIHCGLANKFNEADWLPLIIRRGGNIIENLATGIRSSSITPQQTKFNTPAEFKKGVRSLYLDHYKPVFFIFDQFEELFIFGSKDERREFVNIVKALIESDLQCRLIFVMREEYMASITEFEKVIPSFLANRVRIEKMSHSNALEAIEKPCKIFNINLEEGFSESLLEKLSPGTSEIELTYLQVFLDKIFRSAANDQQIKDDTRQLQFSTALLNKLGNVSDLLGSFLDDQISLMNDPDSSLTILKAFVSGKGTKRPASESETTENVRSLGKDISPESVIELIQTFVKLRVLRDKDDHGRYELRHDSLAEKIFEKFTLSEKELLEVRKFVENAYYSFETRGIFLNKEDLDYLAAFDNKLNLPLTLSEFVRNSKEKLFIRQRALKRIIRISTLIFLLIIAIVGRFYFKSQADSKVNDLFGLALIQSERNPALGISTELKIWEKDSTSTQLQSIILKDFQKLLMMNTDSSGPLYNLQQDLNPVRFTSKIIKAEISNTGKYLYGWLENREIFTFNTKSRKICLFNASGELSAINISEKDSVLALIYKNNTGVICDYNGNIHYSFETTINELLNEKLVCFINSDSCQLVVANGNKASIINKTGKLISSLKAHSGRINSVDASPDGNYIVTASGDTRGYIWYQNKISGQFTFYDSLIGHNETIWSCRFNKTGKYIITTSADSTIRIWDLNGRQIDPEFIFAFNRLAGRRVKLNKGEYDEDAYNPATSKYYGKFCDALFSSDEKEIIATGYSIVNDSINTSGVLLHKVVFFDINSELPGAFKRSFFYVRMRTDTIFPVLYRELAISPVGKYLAAANLINNDLYLLSGDGRKLLTTTGLKAIFSGDGNQLFIISANTIRILPVTTREVKRLLERFEVTETIKNREGDFVEL